MDCQAAADFADKLEDMVKFLIPNYAKEGKTSLVIGIGCTGGKHRSVTLARVLYDRPVSYTHLDVYKRQGKYGWLRI